MIFVKYPLHGIKVNINDFSKFHNYSFSLTRLGDTSTKCDYRFLISIIDDYKM